MDALPNELIEIIFSMVPVDELVAKFRVVNKSFFAITQRAVSEISPSFRRDQTYNDYQIMVLARDFPTITSLDASKWHVSTSTARVILTQFPYLQTLKLRAPSYTLAKEMSKHILPTVTSLSLVIAKEPYDLALKPFEVDSINKIFPNLERLELLDTPREAQVDNILKGSNTIKSLTLHGSEVFRVVNMPVLKTLTLVNNGAESFNISNCPILETLSIEQCNFREFNSLLNIPSLLNLHICRGFQDRYEDSYKYPNASKELVENILNHSPNIKTLRIDQYKITSDLFERLVNGLKSLEKIEINNANYDEHFSITAAILQEKHSKIKIIVSARKFTTGIDLEEYNRLLTVEKTTDPYVKCQYCHQQYQCAPEIHEEVCYEWPAWNCMFAQDGCGKTGMTKDEYRAHIDKCDYNFIICPFTQQCGETIRRHERHEHLKKHQKTFNFRLKETHMFCPNLQSGCLELFSSASDLSNHVSKCQHCHPLCMSCKKEFASIDECAKHMSECKVTQKRQFIPDEFLPIIVQKATQFSESNARAGDAKLAIQSHFYRTSSYGFVLNQCMLELKFSSIK